MAKKIAAPRKTAPKTPARKKAVSKKVTAPLRHKPKGSPKEKLAHLNKGEMAALVKRKGSPARKGPKGLPSFADDSASSTGVSRGDKSGTKGSGSTKTASGSVSNSSGGYNSGTSGSRGGGASTQSPGAGGNSGRVGGGGQGGYNSGVSGSRYGGASTQKPGMGRNEGQVGPRSPMGGQGSSCKTPEDASRYNKGPAIGVEDQRGLQNMPQRPYIDKNKVVNPNVPEPDYDKMNRDYLGRLEARSRAAAKNIYGDKYSTPREIRSQAESILDDTLQSQLRRERRQEGLTDNRSRFKDPAFEASNRFNSSRTPDIKVGQGPRAGSTGIGSSGGGRGGGGGRGFKSGGIVKPKTFKKK